MKLITMFLLLSILPGTIKWEADFNNAKKTAKEKNELFPIFRRSNRNCMTYLCNHCNSSIVQLRDRWR